MDNKVEFVNIDKEVLEKALGERAIECISDPIKFKRAELNFFAEFLSAMSENNKLLDEILRQFTMCTYDKALDFFQQTKENIEKEKNKAVAKSIVEKSHEKPKK